MWVTKPLSIRDERTVFSFGAAVKVQHGWVGAGARVRQSDGIRRLVGGGID